MRKELSLMLLAMLALSAIGQPVLPTRYEGYLTDPDGDPVEGLEIVVRDTDGTIVSRSGATNQEGVYNLNVIWDDPLTGSDEGISQGEDIIFYVSGKEVERVEVGSQGTKVRLDLEYPEDVPASDRSSSSSSSSDSVPQINEDVSEVIEEDAGDGSEPDGANQESSSPVQDIEGEQTEDSSPKSAPENDSGIEIKEENGTRLFIAAFSVLAIMLIIYFITKKKIR